MLGRVCEQTIEQVQARKSDPTLMEMLTLAMRFLLGGTRALEVTGSTAV